MRANLAYQKWLANKRREQEERKREKRFEQEVRALEEEQRRVRQVKAEDNFSSWKRQKDIEKRLMCGSTGENPDANSEQACTPSLPGYCSVWSCDEQLADHMTARVHRGTAYSLANYH